MPDPIEQLRALVLGDIELHRSLLAVTDRQELGVTLSAVASDHGIAITPSEIADALLAARRAWLERWV